MEEGGGGGWGEGRGWSQYRYTAEPIKCGCGLHSVYNMATGQDHIGGQEDPCAPGVTLNNAHHHVGEYLGRSLWRIGRLCMGKY